MTPLLPHVREPAGEPDVCAYCCEEWMDVDPTEACPLRRLPWVFQDVLPVCPYCQPPVRVYQEHPDHGARWDDANTQSFVEALVAALESAPG